MADNPKETKEAPAVTAAAGSSSGLVQTWLPLVLTCVLMPVLAYAMTMFVLVPKMQKALGGATVEAREDGNNSGGSASANGSSGTAGHSAKSGSKESPNGKPKFKVPLTKLIVNVSGSMGSRMMVASLTLAGSTADFKQRIEEENDQLRDLASSVLSTKTITDLEKPEARNLIRAELMTQFNTVLGSGVVQEIYLTEFAVQ